MISVWEMKTTSDQTIVRCDVCNGTGIIHGWWEDHWTNVRVLCDACDGTGNVIKLTVDVLGNENQRRD